MKKVNTLMLLILTMVLFLCGCSVKERILNIKNSGSAVEGNWIYVQDDELMQHFNEKIYFGDDGTFLSSTWREKYVGEYKEDGNMIEVHYDFYFNGAGSTEYVYAGSGTKIFEFTDEELKFVRELQEDGYVNNEERTYSRSEEEMKDGFFDNIVLKEN